MPGFITIFEAANINEWNIDEYYYNIPDQLAIYNINQQRYDIAIVTAKPLASAGGPQAVEIFSAA
ncbi:hypothetical protein QOZ95_002226 [Paenibacillus brasilensis]|uniref:Uncharacterized protein n=1 Tax=Paenibacillus brasilensis TaxID=128574 RepID=A0ABU0L0Q3_9BACL|nr:hypothetical protein [Paenibacillus brasilensis]